MARKKLRVGILFGGRSGEHEISLRSALTVMSSMDPERYEIIPIGIARDGRWRLHADAVSLLKQSTPKLHSLSYSRDVEERADLTGADICAGTNYNPWGLVWLFQDFSNANMKTPPEILSDHPDNQNRINALEKHMRENPAEFSRFSSDPQTATRLQVPKDTAEVFMR